MHRFLLLFSITIAGVCANDPVFITGSYGSQTLYRGYEAWVAVGVRWIHGTQFTVDPSTSVITAPGNSFKNGSTVYVRSDGTLPHPLVQYGGYTVTEATDNTFKLQSVKFDDEGTGTHIIGPSGNGRIYWTTPSGAPPGVTISFWCAYYLPNCSYDSPHRMYAGWDGLSFFIRFTASRSAALGPAEISVTYHSDGQDPDQTVRIPITVADLSPVAITPPSQYPPVPAKADWQKRMLAYGRAYCKPDNVNVNCAFGCDCTVCMYDGAWAYYQLADDTRDASWNNCAVNIANQFRDLILGANGAVQPWRLFLDGARRRAAETGDESFRKVIELAPNKNPYGASGGSLYDGAIRETANNLASYVTYEEVFGKAHPNRDRSANWLLTMFEVLFVQENPQTNQPFYDGLAMRALIKYYSVTRDPRVPVAIKTALDWLWQHAWDDNRQVLFYNPYPNGPRCSTGCLGDATFLGMLVVPAYGWYWSLTGDDTYRDRGDRMFAAAIRAGPSTSKEYGEAALWGYDYLNWREGKPAETDRPASGRRPGDNLPLPPGHK